MGVSGQPTTTAAQHKIKQRQQQQESLHGQVSSHLSSSRSVSAAQNESSYAKPRKRLTNSRSIIKRRRPGGASPSRSDIPPPSSGIRIVRKNLSKSASIIRPVRVRARTRLACSDESQDSDLSKATCSSKFKSRVFPDGEEPQMLETDPSSSTESKKICPYTYCSLHGVGRSQGPQLKRFGSVRRRASRTYSYKPIKPKGSNSATSISDNIHMDNTTQDDHSNSVSQIKEAVQDDENKLSNVSASLVMEKSSEENEKTSRVWRLIYHSMLSAKYRSELYSEVNTDKEVQGIAETAQAHNLEVKSLEIPTAESSQMDAVKLVEDAIDELFLPEVEEQLSINQTITCNISSDAMPRLANQSQIESVKEAKPFSKVGSESMSKNWSKLKQVILLKRFVKSLDKLRELKFKEPRTLNVESNPEMEKVCLRHQTTDEKRLADEWMLDYALRLAVSKLTPARRKKVEILIEAFESVMPSSQNDTPRSHDLSNYRVSSNPSKDVFQESTAITKGPENTIQKPSFVLIKDALDSEDEARSVSSAEQPPLLTLNSQDTSVLDKFVARSQNLHDHDQRMSILQHHSSAKPIGHFDEELVEHREKKSIQSPVCSFDSVDENPESDNMTKIYSDLAYETVQDSPLLRESGMHTQHDAQLDNQKYFKMWGMIYNHVVSGSAAKIGSELNITESADGREIMESKIDAVKLVEDALDEMLLPEYQDKSSDDQSITSDQDQLDRADSETWDSEISTPKDSISSYFKDVNQTKDNTPTEAWRKADVATHTQQLQITEKGVNKFSRLRSNGWSNLKKFIMLKRFIRALDKLKKFKPREPNYLCLEPDQERENVSLKHQTTDERLSADQWMLDNAIQQVVARLTPARKRRVELLVEAFETAEAFLPLPNTKTRLKLSQSSQSPARAKQL